MQRRELLRMAAWAAGAGTLGRVAAACTGGDGARSGAAGLERELHILSHADAFAPELLEGFRRATGVRVTLEQYDPRAAPAISAADASFDLIGFPGPVPGAFTAEGRLGAIDGSRIPGLDALPPTLRPVGTDVLGVPFAWEATGIAWRPALVPETPGASTDTWCVFFEPTLSGRMTMLDSARDVLGAMLLLRGHSPNTTAAEQLEQARDDALACRPFLESYRARGHAPFMAEGIAVCQARSGEAARAMRADAGIAFAIPKEGGLLFAEHLALTASAAHPRAAHAFIEYLLRPEAARIAAAAGRNAPLDEIAPAPGPVRLELVRDPGEASSLYDRFWREIRSA